jgi:methylmalonyl-CoA mutase C-terminal domain/subunit
MTARASGDLNLIGRRAAAFDIDHSLPGIAGDLVNKSTSWRWSCSRDGMQRSNAVSARRTTVPYGSCFVKRTYRIVVAKPGLDGHDRGAKTITRALRDHGFEVIYTGLHQTPEQIAETVLQEDADGVGLSLLSGAHLTLFPRVMEELRSRDLGDVLVFGGGVIPDADARALREQGVAEIFGPGSSLKAIGQWLETTLDESEPD